MIRTTPGTRLLLASRFVRSVGQGALAVDFTLYLHALRWTAPAISAILSGALGLGVALTLIAGPLSDRWGRRGFLFFYEAGQFLAALAATLSAHGAVLWPAALVAGFGRGGNGAAGPFTPVEQAWLAQTLTPEQRGPVYSLNAALGFTGNAAGAIIAILPSLIGNSLPGALAYRPLFALSAIGSLICCALIWRTPDLERRRRAPPTPKTQEDHKENRLVIRLMLANLMNGAGVGATGPLIAYWFAVRFHQGPAEIGPLMAAGFLGAAVASIAAGALSRWLGVVRAVVAMRLAGLLLLIALPFAPSFGLAATCYILRAMFNRGTTGARNALNVSIVRQERRGFASSMGNVSMQIPRAVAPMLTGVLFAAGDLGLPFLIGAGFQGAYLALYYWGFRKVDHAGKEA
jgi:predicted MFS family arabinose efflux permease